MVKKRLRQGEGGGGETQKEKVCMGMYTCIKHELEYKMRSYIAFILYY